MTLLGHSHATFESPFNYAPIGLKLESDMLCLFIDNPISICCNVNDLIFVLISHCKSVDAILNVSLMS